MSATPRLLAAGDRVLVAEYGDRIDEEINRHVHLVARALRRRAVAGIIEVVPTYRSVAIHFDPLVTAPKTVADAVRDIEASPGLDDGSPPRVVEVPVVYGGECGPDLGDVAAHAGLSEAEVVSIHASGTYRVYMMGFTPGFPYLGGMSPRIAAPRLPTPRTFVPAGSVGIAASQTGIYPTSSPGGWRLIGRTPVRLFDAGQDPPTLVEAGDTIRFVPVPAGTGVTWPTESPRATADAPADAWLDVLDGGMLTTVQDLGRVGCQRYGVPVAGAMDTLALRVGNRLVGNADGDAGLEMTMVGPSLRFSSDTEIAVTGADLSPRVNDRPITLWRSILVRAGDVFSSGARRRGLRSYLAVRGGLRVPVVLGSRSTYLASAFGGHQGRALQPGDRLPLGTCPQPARRVVRHAREPGAAVSRDPVHVVRVVLGPQDDAFTSEGLETFCTATFVMSPKSDRVGCRFDGPRIAHKAGADIVSDATAFGSVQVSGDGLPIVLMADRGTTGGYTKIATVVSADLRMLAQTVPGERVRFEPVDRASAVAALAGLESWLDGLVRDPDGPAEDRADDIFDEDSGAELAAEGLESFAAALDAQLAPASGPQSGIRAGMSGVVVSVAATAGQVVAERETLLTIEAMKMLNPIRAPRAGRLARVLVQPGELVSADTIVAEFED